MHSFKFVAKVAFFASLASSSPLAHTKRTDPPTGEVAAASSEVTVDVGILNFALTLEHLEHQFYLESLHRFGEQDFRRANVPNPTQAFQNFHHILQHEAQHVKTLQTVITSLGGTPLPPCTYNFGVEDVHGFMAKARIFEKVGVSAYDGAVALLNNPDLQTAAATIDTVEARHASFIATVTGVDPFPENFDVPLDGNQIVTLVSEVIKECPFDIKSTLGAAPAGRLSLAAPHVVRAGREIKVKFDAGQNKPEDHFCSFMFSDKSVVSALSSDFKCKVPRGCRGDIFVAILNKNEKLTLKNSFDLIAAGPIIVNVDTAIEDSCKKFVHGIDIEWKGYGLKQDKAYDVNVEKKGHDAHKSGDYSEEHTYDHSEVEASKDYHEADASNDHSEADASKDHPKVETSSEHSEADASKDHSEVDKSNDHPKVEASTEHPEVVESKDHPKVEASKDHPKVEASTEHSEVEASKDHPKVEASTDHSEVEASKDHPKVEASTEHSEVEASNDHPKVEASIDHSEVEASKDQPKVVSELNVSEKPKEESAHSYRKRGVIWSPSGHAESPLSDATPDHGEADANHDGYGAEVESADKSNGYYYGDAVESDHAEDQVEADHMEEQNDMENNDMHKSIENSDMEQDDWNNNDMHKATESDMEHDDTENSDMEHDDKENSDMEHGWENNDMEHDDKENSDMEHDDWKNNDMEHDDKENSDMEHDDAENSDMEHDNMENSDHEASGDKSADISLPTPASAEPAVNETLETVVAVYGTPTLLPEAPESTTPLPAETPILEAPEVSDSSATPLPAEPTVSEASEETIISPTPLPDQSTVPPAEAEVPEAALAGDVTSTDDVIKALRVEVAQAIAGDGSFSDVKDDVLDALEVEEEPASEDDGTETEASDSDLETDDIDAKDQTETEDAPDTGLSDSKIGAADPSNLVADLEAQLQKLA